MRVYIFATLLAFCNSFNANSNSTDTKLVPKFYLLEKENSNDAPSVGITFPDGHKDTLLLDKVYDNDKYQKNGTKWCFYNGHLEKESDACVAMTGCVGLEDVEFTIFSSHSKSNIFNWTKDGNVVVVDDLSEVNHFKLSVCFIFALKLINFVL